MVVVMVIPAKGKHGRRKKKDRSDSRIKDVFPSCAGAASELCYRGPVSALGNYAFFPSFLPKWYLGRQNGQMVGEIER